jgi:signal transduction histidine kinase
MFAKIGNERWELVGLLVAAALVIVPTVALSFLGMASLSGAQAAFEKEIRDAYTAAAQSAMAQSMTALTDRTEKLKALSVAFAADPSPAGRLNVARADVTVSGMVVLDSHWRGVYPAGRAAADAAGAAIPGALSAAEAVEARQGPAAAIPMYQSLTANAAGSDPFAARALADMARSYTSTGRTADAVPVLERLSLMEHHGGEISLPLFALFRIWEIKQTDQARSDLLAACLRDAFVAPASQLRYYFSAVRATYAEAVQAHAEDVLAAMVYYNSDKQLLAAAPYFVGTDAFAAGQVRPSWKWSALSIGPKGYLAGTMSIQEPAGPQAVVVFVDSGTLISDVIKPVLDRQADGASKRLALSVEDLPFPMGPSRRPRRTIMLGPEVIVAQTFPAPFEFLLMKATIKGGGLGDLARSRVRLMTWAFALTMIALTVGLASVLIWARARARLARLQTDFVANVTHELKTPLTGIKSLAETIQLGRVTSAERRDEFLESIVKETDRLSRLINNVLDFARMERGTQRMRFERRDLVELAADAVEAFKATLPEGEAAAIRTQLPDKPVLATVDSDCIQRALWNLLDNAQKYSRPPREITVSLSAVDGKAALSVRDNGIGLAPSQLPRIWRKFYRVDSSLAAETQGAGLGLPLVRAYVEAHGGTVHVQSRPGEGSTFSIELPLETGGSDGRG